MSNNLDSIMQSLKMAMNELTKAANKMSKLDGDQSYFYELSGNNNISLEEGCTYRGYRYVGTIKDGVTAWMDAPKQYFLCETYEPADN